MNKKVKLKGQLKSYMQWPVLLSLLLVVMNIWIYIIDIKAGILMTVFLGIYMIVVFVLYLYNRPQILNELISFATQYGQIQKKLLAEMELPYALLDRDGKMLWMNQAFSDAVGKERHYKKSITNIFPELPKTILPKEQEEEKFYIEYGDQDFRVDIKRVKMDGLTEASSLIEAGEQQEFLYAVYIFDETDMRHYMKENQDQKLVAGLIYIDNYDEVLQTVEAVRRSLLIALIDRKINKYFDHLDGIVRKMENDKYFIAVKHKYLSHLQSDKFSILDEVKAVNIGNEMDVTLSIGIGTAGETYGKNYEYAQIAIDLALGRGGDQAVIKEKEKIYYYGGKSKQVEKSTRVKARVKAQALREFMTNKDKVVVMGHKMGDVDCFGAAIGIYRAAMVLGKKVYVVINDITTSVRPLIDQFLDNEEYAEDMFISGNEAVEIVDDSTTLIVVDTNRPNFTECEELLSLTPTIVVLDHHRRSSDSIDNAVLNYIEPYASSTCEMVAEILQYFDDEIKIRHLEAECLYAGIMIDTNNFMSKTGVRTFEAAAFLKRCGADITSVRKLFRDDMDAYKTKAETVRNSEAYRECFAISVCPTNYVESPTIVGAQAANELLNINGIKASFVLTDYNNKIYVSARSIDSINVQLIMERIGGGGHLNIAGAQMEGISLQEGIRKLKEVIDEMIEGGDL